MISWKSLSKPASPNKFFLSFLEKDVHIIRMYIPLSSEKNYAIIIAFYRGKKYKKNFEKLMLTDLFKKSKGNTSVLHIYYP